MTANGAEGFGVSHQLVRFSGMDPHDIDWERLDRYVAGEGTSEELEELRRWVESDSRLQTLAETMRTAQRLPGGSALRWDAAGSWRAVAERLGLPQDPAASPAAPTPAARRGGRTAQPLRLASGGISRRWRSTRILAAAAAAAVAGILGIDWWAAREVARRAAMPRPIAEASREYVARRGERLVVHLSDRTQITLAPETRVRLSPTYGEGSREVELEGQAYFVVAHDSTRPFSVRTDRFLARDLGTRFVVRAYPTDSTRHVVVAEGVVALGKAQAPEAQLRDSLVLGQGDLGRLTPAGSLGRVQGVDVDRFLAWTAGELRLQNTRLRDAAVELGRWYGVEVTLADPSAAGEQVTASFKDEPAPVAIGLVAAAAGMVVDANGTQYTLRRKRS